MISIDLSKTQKYLEWINTKLYLDAISEKAKCRLVKRGQTYWCHFGIGVGSEMSKDHPRPCVILQNNIGNLHSGNTIVAPITHNTGEKKYLIPVTPKQNSNGEIILDGQVNLSNIVCVSKSRLGDPIVQLTSTEMKTIDEALAINLALMDYYSSLKKQLEDKLGYIAKLKMQRNEAQDLLKEIKMLIEINQEIDIENIKKVIDKFKF